MLRSFILRYAFIYRFSFHNGNLMVIQISKITYKDSLRIKIDVPFNAEASSKIRQIPDARWSQSLRSWHIPYTKSGYAKLIDLFRDDEIVINDPVPAIVVSTEINKQLSPKTVVPPEKIKPDSPAAVVPPQADVLNNKNLVDFSKPIPNSLRNQITIEVAGRRLILRMPKNDVDIQFVRTFQYVQWNANIHAWIVPHYKRNLDILKEYFGLRLYSIEYQKEFEIGVRTANRRILEKDTLLVVKTRNNRLRAIYGYNQVLTNSIKTIHFARWDANNKWWSIPFSDAIMQLLQTAAGSQNMQFVLEEESADHFSAIW